jgi:hypothetical protein
MDGKSFLAKAFVIDSIFGKIAEDHAKIVDRCARCGFAHGLFRMPERL